MEAIKLIEAHSNEAEIYHGKAVCTDKMTKLLEEFSLPKGFLPLDEVEEVGYNKSDGFLWIKQEQKSEHKFQRIGETIIYEALITAFIEQKHLTKLTGVKAKKSFIQPNVCNILAGAPSGDMIKFTTTVGFSASHPISAFEPEEDKDESNLSQK